MNLILNQVFDSVIVSGDIHAKINELVEKITDQYDIQNSLIIVAGDVGMGFKENNYYLELFKEIETILKKNNNTLFLVRGNHDNPEIWNDNIDFKAYWQDTVSHIRLIKDYTVITTQTASESHNILCVGGALSIDRTARTIGKNYWSNEPFVYDESKVESLVGITAVVTHSAPSFCEPILKNGIKNWMEVDKDIEEDCNKERNDHTLLYNKLKEKNTITKWFYGHFHYSHRIQIDNTLFCLCGIMELVEL